MRISDWKFSRVLFRSCLSRGRYPLALFRCPDLRMVLAFGTGVVRRIGQAEEGAARGFAGEAQGRRLGLAEQRVAVDLVVPQRAGIGGVAEPALSGPQKSPGRGNTVAPAPAPASNTSEARNGACEERKRSE